VDQEEPCRPVTVEPRRHLTRIRVGVKHGTGVDFSSDADNGVPAMPFVVDPSTSSAVFDQYPTPIVTALKAALAVSSNEVATHRALLELAETVLQYLALVSWFEYVAHGPRSAKLDEFVTSVQRPSMGHWVRLFRDASKCNGTSVLSFPVTQKFPPAQLQDQANFVAMYEVVKEALSFEIPPGK
jgi:hypothetical protein